MATQDVTIPNMLQQLYEAKLYLITVIMFDLTEIDKSWSGVNISRFSEKCFSSLEVTSCDFIIPSWSNLFSRFYSEYKQRHKDEYQNDISQPYKYPGNWQVRILYHLLARGQTDTKAQAGHDDQHCFYLS